MTITIVFLASTTKKPITITKTARIKDAEQLSKIATRDKIKTLVPCKYVAGKGYITIGEAEAIEIKNDSELVPLPINAFLAVDNAIDKYGTTYFMVA